MSSFKSIDYSKITKDGEQYPKVIWTGNNYMNADQTIPIDMDSYPNGIWLQWCRYDYENSVSFDYGHNVFTYLKEMLYTGNGFCVLLVSQTGTAQGLKYIYIDKTYIKGNAQNNQTISTSFGSVNNKNWILRRVVAF